MHDLVKHRQVLDELRPIYRFTELGELMACEAVYQRTAMACRQYRLLLSREQFLKGNFTVSTTCDGLIALAQAECPMGLVLQKVPQPNGLRDRIYRQ